MKFLILTMLMVVAATSATAENPFLNLDFEDGQAGSSPQSWYAGGKGYSGSVCTENPHSGVQCLQLSKTDSPEKGFGVGTNTFPIAAAAGRSLRFTGWIRTSGVTEGYAGLWWRVDGPDGILAFDNMYARGVKGDTDWTEYTIELDIPAEVTNINFGCLMPGNGTAWFDDLQVELDGEIYRQIRPEPFLATPAQVAWISQTAHVFATDDPGHGNEDLEFLEGMIGDAYVVSLGEGTHGTAEFFRMKHRMIRYLAEEMGFTLFGIEATMPEAELLNHYVLTGEGDPAALIAGMYFWTWRTEEVLALVQWMRQHNARGGRMEFHGIDMQFPGLAMKTVVDFVEKFAPDLLLKTSITYAELRGLAQGAGQQDSGRAPVSAKLLSTVISIRENLEGVPAESVQGVSPDHVEWAIQNARLVEQYCQMVGGDSGARDRSMADNADWLLQQAGPEAKMVLWSHNVHASRLGHYVMGSHLDRLYGEDMVVFGFFFHDGTYTAIKQGEGLGSWGTSASRTGSVEWAFHKVGKPRLVLDLRLSVPGSEESGWVWELVEFRSIGAMAMDDAFNAGVMMDRFDALVFFESSTPSVLLDVTPPSAWAMWE